MGLLFAFSSFLIMKSCLNEKTNKISKFCITTYIGMALLKTREGSKKILKNVAIAAFINNDRKANTFRCLILCEHKFQHK